MGGGSRPKRIISLVFTSFCSCNFSIEYDLILLFFLFVLPWPILICLSDPIGLPCFYAFIIDVFLTF